MTYGLKALSFKPQLRPANARVHIIMRSSNVTMGAVHTRVWHAACLQNAPVATSDTVVRSLISTHVLRKTQPRCLAGYEAKSHGALVEERYVSPRDTYDAHKLAGMALAIARCRGKRGFGTYRTPPRSATALSLHSSIAQCYNNHVRTEIYDPVSYAF